MLGGSECPGLGRQAGCCGDCDVAGSVLADAGTSASVVDNACARCVPAADGFCDLDSYSLG